MEFDTFSGAIATESYPAIVVGVYDNELTPAATELNSASQGYLDKILERGDLDKAPGSTLVLQDIPGLNFERTILVALGEKDKLSAVRYLRAVSGAINALLSTKAEHALCTLSTADVSDRDNNWKLRYAIQGACDRIYRFEQLKTNKAKPAPVLKKITYRTDADKADKIIKQAHAIGAGMALTKDLGNLPGNMCTPTYLAEQAKTLAKDNHEIKVTILEEKEMQKLGMGALLSVARGSEQPAKFIVMEYHGATKNDKPVVLVGKGITFDSGGISIKPSAAMDEMKYDMCGAASVFGTMKAIADMACPINLVGIVATTENLPGGKATKPGDVVTSMSGQTIEILNTDAEGRLILCDALTYAERFEPDVVVDMATLTGAMVVALGNDITGVFANDDDLAQELLTASKQSCDHAWRMPIWDDYNEIIDTNFADVANSGSRAAGSITAACFLDRFTKQYRWAHMDIAGTAYISGKEKGATGRPVPLLTQFILNRCSDEA